jgi:c-di-GMP-binding flagellar brake protein YcgR
MAEGKMFIEKRRYKRVQKNFNVRYKIMPKENNIEAIRKEGSSHDISIGGLKLEGPLDGDVGDVARVEFTIPEKTMPVVAFAEVKWVIREKGKTQFGLEFLALQDEDKRIIENIINNEK